MNIFLNLIVHKTAISNLSRLCSKAAASKQSRKSHIRKILYKTPLTVGIHCKIMISHLERIFMLPQASHRLKSSAFRYLEVSVRKVLSLNESALSKLRHCLLIFNHYKLAPFCFLSDVYWVKLW